MLRHTALVQLAASFGVGISRRQRPSIRAGLDTRHPILYASFDREEGLREATPSHRPLASQTRVLNGPPLPASASRRAAASLKRLPLFEHGPFG
jgi:hypothetical protein